MLIRSNTAASTAPRVRHAVEVDATIPNNSGWLLNERRSEIVLAPSANATARSTSTPPRSWPRRRFFVGAIATDNAPVRPTSSARSHNRRAPTWLTTPLPPVVTDIAGRVGLRFGVAEAWGNLKMVKESLLKSKAWKNWSEEMDKMYNSKHPLQSQEYFYQLLQEAQLILTQNATATMPRDVSLMAGMVARSASPHP